MKKATIAAMLFALAAWAFPIHAASAELINKDAITSNQTLPQTHDNSGENAIIADTPKRQKESKAKEQAKTKIEPYSGKTYTKDEVVQLIKDYSTQYGINSETPLCIAKLESGFNQFSKNKNSTASGVFQYLSGTWRATDEGKLGLSVFDGDANVRAAVKYMAIHKSTKAWTVAPRCPNLTFL